MSQRLLVQNWRKVSNCLLKDVSGKADEQCWCRGNEWQTGSPDSLSRDVGTREQMYVPVGPKRGAEGLFPKRCRSFSFCLMSVLFLEH